MMIHILVVFTCFFSLCLSAQFEGEKCVINETGVKGTCRELEKCEYAINLLKIKQRPQHCGFKERTPIVCCPESVKTIGEKSKKQCLKYYPTDLFRTQVFGGTPSLAKQFPHMAAVGYGDRNNVQWLCGGSLISEEFVMTAAHCIYSQDLGNVKWVRLGDLDLKNTTDDAKPQDFSVTEFFVHPQYRRPSHYHDIALLKLNRPAKFDEYVEPACLHVTKTLPEDPLVATGWGKVEFLGESSSHLLKVDLNYVSHKDCSKTYATVSKNRLANGIVDDMQLCAGHPEGKDTCPGDSGGPLQVKVNGPGAHFNIVGVTSFGKACGIQNSAGVYTRVSHYVPWIEDIVWND